MRALVLPLNADHHQDGQLCAFRRVLGATNVDELDYFNIPDPEQRLIQLATDLKPEWVWMQLQTTEKIDGSAIEAARQASPRTVFTHWMGDWRTHITPKLASVCAASDVTFVSSEGQRAMYAQTGAKRIEYLQIGLDWHEDVLGQPPWTPPFRVPQVVLCGNFYGASFPGTGERLQAVRTLQNAGVDVGVIGGGWPSEVRTVGGCTVKQQHHVYKKALVALNVNNANDTKLYYSDRQLISMASGTPLVCKYVPGLEEEFVDGEHCMFFRDQAELKDRVMQLLADEALRYRIGAAGRSLMMQHHSWADRVRHMKRIVEEIMPS